MDAVARAHVEAASQAALVRIAEAIERDARRFAPVDTGELVSSIEAEDPVGMTIRIVARADHALYVEKGTEKMAAQPYLAPALYRKRVI